MPLLRFGLGFDKVFHHVTSVHHREVLSKIVKPDLGNFGRIHIFSGDRLHPMSLGWMSWCCDAWAVGLVDERMRTLEAFLPRPSCLGFPVQEDGKTWNLRSPSRATISSLRMVAKPLKTHPDALSKQSTCLKGTLIKIPRVNQGENAKALSVGFGLAVRFMDK